MRLVFFGSPDFAVPGLEALHEISDVAAVISQPDRPAGRGLALRPPAVKQRALGLGLDVWQPKKVRTPEFARNREQLYQPSLQSENRVVENHQEQIPDFGVT